MTMETTVWRYETNEHTVTVGAPPFRYVSCVNKSMYIILILHHVNSDISEVISNWAFNQLNICLGSKDLYRIPL